eukprot:snap_masked-scaffold_6-processed-gene-3.23-mRNA-1 protein AED:1.00 eAED:1.00 QI:0/0/0/0/1/1/2/0/80
MSIYFLKNIDCRGDAPKEVSYLSTIDGDGVTIMVFLFKFRAMGIKFQSTSHDRFDFISFAEFRSLQAFVALCFACYDIYL